PGLAHICTDFVADFAEKNKTASKELFELLLHPNTKKYAMEMDYSSRLKPAQLEKLVNKLSGSQKLGDILRKALLEKNLVNVVAAKGDKSVVTAEKKGSKSRLKI
ncbi:MAG: hypothetical protein AB1468_06880, partial [Candidatus Micrarchaeota archaeon]